MILCFAPSDVSLLNEAKLHYARFLTVLIIIAKTQAIFLSHGLKNI